MRGDAYRPFERAPVLMNAGMHPSGKMRCFYVVREASEEERDLRLQAI